MPTHPRQLGVGVAVTALVLSAAACSHSDQKPASGPTTSAPPSSSSPTATAPPALTAQVGVVAGRLPKADRAAAAAAVGKVVDGYLDAAYVGGTWPRTDFGMAFPGFTKGAAAEAGMQVRRLSNAGVGGQIESVTVQQKSAKVDLVAADKKAVGATARFRLAFTTTGGYAHRVRVYGRLFLTPVHGAWKVFGFVVRKGEK